MGCGADSAAGGLEGLMDVLITLGFVWARRHEINLVSSCRLGGPIRIGFLWVRRPHNSSISFVC